MKRHTCFLLPMVFSILLSTSTGACRKDPVIPEGGTICSGCLPGNWELVRGVKLIDGDTIELFDNNRVYSCWYGVREPYITADRRILKIGVDTFRFDVSSYQPEPWKDTTGAGASPKPCIAISAEQPIHPFLLSSKSQGSDS